jgi:DNA-binding sugar fermentation-stimulating protein
MGQNSSVGIVTCYGLDSPGIESRWGARFSTSVQNGHGTHPASYTMDTGSFTEVKRPGRDVDHTTPSTAEVKERVKLYVSPPLGLRGLL